MENMTAVLVVAAPLLLAVFAAQMERLEAALIRHTTGASEPEDEDDPESDPVDISASPTVGAREELPTP